MMRVRVRLPLGASIPPCSRKIHQLFPQGGGGGHSIFKKSVRGGGHFHLEMSLKFCHFFIWKASLSSSFINSIFDAQLVKSNRDEAKIVSLHIQTLPPTSTFHT